MDSFEQELRTPWARPSRPPAGGTTSRRRPSRRTVAVAPCGEPRQA